MASTKTDKKKCRPKDELYFVLMDVDFTWLPDKVVKVKSLWQSGADIKKIADVVDRDVDEVFLLLLDLARNKKIKTGENGIFGR